MNLGFPIDLLALFIALSGGALTWDVLTQRVRLVPLTLGEATIRSLVYVSVALLFAGYLFVEYGHAIGSLFLAGYVMEKVLSVDNLLVFAAIFAYFRVGPIQQVSLLHLGVAGAVLLRLLFVVVGVGSLWLFGRGTELVFGALVGWSAWALWRSDAAEEIDYAALWFVKLARRFSVQPWFLCLVTIELSDIMFAFDSVPAVIAVTQEPLLVFTSMLFAVLGLRAMYFVIEALQRSLVHLGTAVLVVLIFISAKLVVHALWGVEVGPLVSLAVVLSVLGIGVVASWTARDLALDLQTTGKNRTKRTE